LLWKKGTILDKEEGILLEEGGRGDTTVETGRRRVFLVEKRVMR